MSGAEVVVSDHAAAKLTRRARARTGLTQLQFAHAIGANRATVAAWEAGLREPSRLTLSLLCLIATFGEEATDQLERCHRALDRAARARLEA